MTQEPVDRKLDDPYLDMMDQALGRPKDPMQETPRNLIRIRDNARKTLTEYADIGPPYWVAIYSDVDWTYYSVTQQGKLHLRAYLKKTGKL